MSSYTYFSKRQHFYSYRAFFGLQAGNWSPSPAQDAMLWAVPPMPRSSFDIAGCSEQLTKAPLRRLAHQINIQHLKRTDFQSHLRLEHANYFKSLGDW